MSAGEPFGRQGRRAGQGAFDAICLVVFIGGLAFLVLATLAKALIS